MGGGRPGVPGTGTVRGLCIRNALMIFDSSIVGNTDRIFSCRERRFCFLIDGFYGKGTSASFCYQADFRAAVLFVLCQEQIRRFVGHVTAADDCLPEIPGVLHLAVGIGSTDQQRICRHRKGILRRKRDVDIRQDRPEITGTGLLQNIVGSIRQNRSLIRGQRELQNGGISVLAADGFFQRRQGPVGLIPAGRSFHKELYHIHVGRARRVKAVGNGFRGGVKAAVPSGKIDGQASCTRHVGSPGQQDAFTGLI